MQLAVAPAAVAVEVGVAGAAVKITGLSVLVPQAPGCCCASPQDIVSADRSQVVVVVVVAGVAVEDMSSKFPRKPDHMSEFAENNGLRSLGCIHDEARRRCEVATVSWRGSAWLCSGEESSQDSLFGLLVALYLSCFCNKRTRYSYSRCSCA